MRQAAERDPVLKATQAADDTTVQSPAPRTNPSATPCNDLHPQVLTIALAKQKSSLVPSKIRELPLADNVPDPAQAPPKAVKFAEALRSLAV